MGLCMSAYGVCGLTRYLLGHGKDLSGYSVVFEFACLDFVFSFNYLTESGRIQLHAVKVYLILTQ
jgi:hypothetical protein